MPSYNPSTGTFFRAERLNSYWFVAQAEGLRPTLIIHLVQRIGQPKWIDHSHDQSLQDA
jgi:hypothetical protein